MGVYIADTCIDTPVASGSEFCSGASAWKPSRSVGIAASRLRPVANALAGSSGIATSCASYETGVGTRRSALGELV